MQQFDKKNKDYYSILESSKDQVQDKSSRNPYMI